jgi:hypothetical protein
VGIVATEVEEAEADVINALTGTATNALRARGCAYCFGWYLG